MRLKFFSLVSLLVSLGCQTTILKDAHASYVYQTERYQVLCPQPPTDKLQQTPCGVRDAELTFDFNIIQAAKDAYTGSQGGKLPSSAVDALKRIRVQLDQDAKLP